MSIFKKRADPHGRMKNLRGPGADIPPDPGQMYPFRAILAGASLHIRMSKERERFLTRWSTYRKQHGLTQTITTRKIDATDPEGAGYRAELKGPSA